MERSFAQGSYSAETQLKALNQNSSWWTGLRLLWLNTCTPSQCCFSHRACLISGDVADENHGNRREHWDEWSGTVRLPRSACDSSAQSKFCKPCCLLSIGHSLPWRQDHFHKCSCSPTPTQAGISTHTPTPARARSRALLNRKMKSISIRCVYSNLSLTVFFANSPRPAVSPPYSGRVICSLPA